MSDYKEKNLESLTGPLLDSSGVLIPKKLSFYSPEELAKLKHKEQKPSLLFPQQITEIKPLKKVKDISEILGIEIEEDAVEEPAVFATLTSRGPKKQMSYEAAQNSIKSRGFDRFIMPSELVKLYDHGKSGNGLAMELYYSIVRNGGEWFNMAWMSQNNEISIYEKPTGLKLVNTYPKGIQQVGYTASRHCYDRKNLQYQIKHKFKLKNMSIGTKIQLDIYPQLFEYLMGIKDIDYPPLFPEPTIEFPDQPFEVWPLGFEMDHGKITIKGYPYRGCRGVRQVTK